MVFLTIALSLAMVSNIRYARLPRIGFRTWRGLLGWGVHLTILGFGIWQRDIFFFPLGITYLTYGLARAPAGGFLRGGGEDGVQAEVNPAVVRPDIDAAGRVRRREPGAKDG